ncbi:hypothetical protein J6590_106576 [Homalodisca vitripennis]|nr:hypothetical protein J6590_106576 [Homalodisca vitripennis]
MASHRAEIQSGLYADGEFGSTLTLLISANLASFQRDGNTAPTKRVLNIFSSTSGYHAATTCGISARKPLGRKAFLLRVVDTAATNSCSVKMRTSATGLATLTSCLTGRLEKRAFTIAEIIPVGISVLLAPIPPIFFSQVCILTPRVRVHLLAELTPASRLAQTFPRVVSEALTNHKRLLSASCMSRYKPQPQLLPWILKHRNTSLDTKI